MSKKATVRSKDVSIQHVGDETIIFDRLNEVVHRVSRRDFMRNVGVAAGTAVLIPVIDSLAVPADAAPEPGRCKGRHLVSVVGVGPNQHTASQNAYDLSVHKAEEVCKTFNCDEGECVSTGHPFYPLKPSCNKLSDGSWKCTLRYSAVCKCTGGQD